MRLDHKFIVYSIGVIAILWVTVFIFNRPNQAGIKEVAAKFESVLALSKDDHYKWQTDSDITVINYYSIDCPYCRELFVEESKYRMLYENTFSLVYRPSPLPDVQPLSLEKAVVAECVFRQAGEEGLFKLLTDVFTNYNLNQENNIWVEKIASNYIKDREEFSTCRNGDGLKTVLKQTKQSLADGVYGTPTIIVMRGDEIILRLDKPNTRTVISTFNQIRKI